jgi:signal recognition particle GTPase
MKPSEMLKEVKTLLGLEIKLEQMKLENGTVLEADAFTEGNEIFIITEDERVALPVGEYVLEDGQILVVEEDGIIKEMKSEDEEAKEEEVEVEAEEEEKEEMGYATKEELAEVKSMIEEIKAMLEPKEEEPKEELKEEVELSEVAQEVVNEIPEEVKQELSQPAAEPINTNAEVSKTQVKFNIASKRKMSTLDRVMSKMNKL